MSCVRLNAPRKQSTEPGKLSLEHSLLGTKNMVNHTSIVCAIVTMHACRRVLTVAEIHVCRCLSTDRLTVKSTPG